MKRTSILLWLCLSMFVLNRCSRNDNSSVKGLKKIELQAIDTIKVKYDGSSLILSDQRKNKLLYFDFFSHDILVTDFTGEILSKFNNTLLGVNNFGKSILGVRFQSDTSICVLSNQGYFVYNLVGKLILNYKHPFRVEKEYVTGDFKLDYDQKRKMFVSLLMASTSFGSNNPDFYDQIKHITTFDTDSLKYRFGIKYEPESSFLQKEYYTSEWGAHFDLDGDTIALVYGRDPIVYFYGLSDFRKIKSFKSYPQYFKQNVRFNFGDNTAANHKLRLTSFSNSSYTKIFSRGDTTITSYKQGIPLDQFDKINNLDDLNNLAYKVQSYYIQVFVKTKNEFEDCKLPKEFPLLELFSNGRIFLSEQERWRIHKDGYKRFLIMKLEYK